MRPFTLCVLIIGLGLGLIRSGLAAAADPPPAPERAAEPLLTPEPTAEPLLTPEPILIESLGVSLNLPPGSIIVREEGAVDPRVHIEDSHSPPRFRLQLQIAQVDPTIRSAAAVAMGHLKTATEQQKTLEVRANEVFEGEHTFGHLIYTAVALDAKTTAITGWLIIPVEPGWCLIASILTSGLDYDAARAALDPAFKTIKLIDAAESYNLRAARMEQGLRLIASISRNLAGLCRDHEPYFYRIYRSEVVQGDSQTTTKDVELGWLMETQMPAPRGAVDPSVKRPYSGTDATSGLMLVIQSETIDPADTTAVQDHDGRYWVAADRSEEIWLARAAERHGQSLKMFNQMGLRAPPSAGRPQPQLQVLNQSSSGQASGESRWTLPIELYLSQFEVRNLGLLLPRDGSFTESASIYAFDPTTGKLILNIIDWRKSSDTEWTLSIRKGMDTPAEVSQYDTDGNLLKRIALDGTITERVDRERLREIWRDKSLPIK